MRRLRLSDDEIYFFGMIGYLLVILVLFTLVAIGIAIGSAYMESETYNRLTGADTSWWDALWVVLRVEGTIK